MRCRNCHTAMMESDSHCPSCHASAASATAAAPGAINKPSPWLVLLPIFGGAIGGAIAAGIATASASSSSSGSRASTGSSSAVRWTFAILFILGGGLFLIAALVQFCDTWKIAQRVPQEITAADLLKAQDPKTPAPAWIAYTFDESKPTKLTVTRKRLGNGGEVKASCLLVRVADKWLITSVPKDFEGTRLVGRLLPPDSPTSKPLIEQVQKAEPKPIALLPFEFNGVDGSESDQQSRYIGAAIVGVLALLGLFFGLRLACKKRPASEAETADNWTFHAVPSR